ncbi:YjbF family lipoprotein [Primorskyibacter sp. 2E107]|uniref:YjbF family lipoprotein n=1 Tax=Primorskyibacter sp. 2E107 TaxID=3403458 RepID=UPI003AF8F6F4
MNIMKKRRFGLGLALIAGLALSACGTEKNPALEYFKTQANLKKAPDGAAPAPIAQQMVGMLAATSAPVEFINIEKRESQGLLVGIERNGPYYSYGSAARQGMVLRSGMITATRGLGGDLMSSEEDALLRAVQARQPGSASYQLRFLTPEDLTRTLNFTCSVTPGGRQIIKAGEIDSAGITMTADCKGEGVTFTNTYVVDPQGTILAGRQWLGFEIGYVGNQALRR